MTDKNEKNSYEELARDNQVTLSDGRRVTIDLYGATWNEITGEIWKPNSKKYEEIMAKMTGLTVEEIGGLSFPDGKLLDKKLAKAIKALNDFDPN